MDGREVISTRMLTCESEFCPMLIDQRTLKCLAVPGLGSSSYHIAVAAEGVRITGPSRNMHGIGFGRLLSEPGSKRTME